jgi:hypothetical protein
MMTFSTYRESTSWFPLIRSLTRFRCTQIAGLLSQVNILVSSSFSSSLFYLFQSGIFFLLIFMIPSHTEFNKNQMYSYCWLTESSIICWYLLSHLLYFICWYLSFQSEIRFKEWDKIWAKEK